MSFGDDRLLTTLHRRADVLGLLVDEPRGKRSLIDELDVSRSTVDRALRELETYNCVTRDGEEFVPTAIGRMLFETYETHYAHVDGVGKATDVLVHLPTSAPLAPDMMADATVLRPDSPTPHTAYQELENIINQSRRFRGISVADTHFRFPSLLRDRTVEDGLPVELIGTPEITDHLRSDFTESMHEAMTEGKLELYQREDLPYGMLLGDRDEGARVAIVVYGPRSDLTGIILNDTPEAVTWARLVYRGYRREATPVDPPSIE
ncbi:MAG: helix-turn-helix transcriptional regulator [Halanaeroarchaeum sp.]